VALTVHHLGCGVSERTCHGLKRILLPAERLGNTEVGEDEVGFEVFGDIYEVLGLEV
jgi:hypothetical protein